MIVHAYRSYVTSPSSGKIVLEVQDGGWAEGDTLEEAIGDLMETDPPRVTLEDHIHYGDYEDSQLIHIRPSGGRVFYRLDYAKAACEVLQWVASDRSRNSEIIPLGNFILYPPDGSVQSASVDTYTFNKSISRRETYGAISAAILSLGGVEEIDSLTPLERHEDPPMQQVRCTWVRSKGRILYCVFTESGRDGHGMWGHFPESSPKIYILGRNYVPPGMRKTLLQRIASWFKPNPKFRA